MNLERVLKRIAAEKWREKKCRVTASAAGLVRYPFQYVEYFVRNQFVPPTR